MSLRMEEEKEESRFFQETIPKILDFFFFLIVVGFVIH